MDDSQIQLIKDKTFIELRERITEILLDHRVLQHHNGQAGWWAMEPNGPVWYSIYDVLEDARD